MFRRVLLFVLIGFSQSTVHADPFSDWLKSASDAWTAFLDLWQAKVDLKIQTLNAVSSIFTSLLNPPTMAPPVTQEVTTAKPAETTPQDGLMKVTKKPQMDGDSVMPPKPPDSPGPGPNTPGTNGSPAGPNGGSSGSPEGSPGTSGGSAGTPENSPGSTEGSSDTAEGSPGSNGGSSGTPEGSPGSNGDSPETSGSNGRPNESPGNDGGINGPGYEDPNYPSYPAYPENYPNFPNYPDYPYPNYDYRSNFPSYQNDNAERFWRDLFGQRNDVKTVK